MVNELILIVDDEPSARDTLEALLFSEGYHLAFAASGQEALDRLDELTPDVILLDVMMPKMDGFEVCQLLKSDKQWRHVPIILVTALDNKQDLARGLDAGADDFVSKPANALELRARVRSMLRIKEQHDLLEAQRRELQTALHLREELARVTDQRLEELEFIYNIGLRLMNTLDADEVVALVSQTALKFIPQAMHCVIHFLSDDQRHLAPVIFSAEGTSRSTHPSVGTEKIVREAIETWKIIYVPNVLADPRHSHSPLYEMRALLVIPLIVDGHPIGTLSVDSPQADVFEIAHRRILSILAGQAASAIVKSRLFDELERTIDREKWSVRGLFQRYVSPIVVHRLLEGEEDPNLGGKRRTVTVLFGDIRGFAAFSENLDPERLIEILNRHLALAVDATLAEEGMLDKIMGDSVMAFFGAPLFQADHTLRAVRAALAMRQAVSDYHLEGGDQPPLSFGVGIHVGEAVVGNVGTVQQMNYTAVGDTVNLAKRLQEHASGGQIILSHAAYQVVKGIVEVRDLGLLAVKGRKAKERAYSLIHLAEKTILSHSC